MFVLNIQFVPLSLKYIIILFIYFIYLFIYLFLQRVPWNSGKTLGGGSVLNAMLYVRGNMRNYDEWEADGAIGWSYDDVLPYFLKLEDNRNIHELDQGKF